MGINPIELKGDWDKGYALDIHTIHSEFLGTDGYGRDRFDNTRSELGELTKQFKYDGVHENLSLIMDLVIPFLDKWNALGIVNIVLPAPPSNKSRKYQPVYDIASEIAKHLNVSFSTKVLSKTTTIQSKAMNSLDKKSLKGTIIANKKAKKRFNVLIVDDLYQSGTTLNECVRVLKEDENLGKIYVLTMTKTKG
jgi:competence protein ComFC